VTLDNAKIRKIILVEHEGLRGGLRSIESLLGRHENGEEGAVGKAHAELKSFINGFLRHIDHEERILEPVLATIDAWGAVRKKAMDDEHVVQRQVLARLAGLEPGSAPEGWVREVRAFIADLLADMAEEERTCLSANLLRDDVVTVDGAAE
jgi:iron-sulfur cluster repair protein YtfE (RIC family)